MALFAHIQEQYAVKLSNLYNTFADLKADYFAQHITDLITKIQL